MKARTIEWRRPRKRDLRELTSLPTKPRSLGFQYFPLLLVANSPGVVGVRLDSLSPAQVTHSDLAAEALQDDANLVFRGVPAPGSSLNGADE